MVTWRSPLAEPHDGDPRPQGGAALSAAGPALVDISATPRAGYKGPDTADYLAGQGWPPPATANRAAWVTASTTALRVGGGEVWLMAHPQSASAESWPAGGDPGQADGPVSYATDRQNSHAQLALVGEAAPDVLARLGRVDYRLTAFADGQIAQSLLANQAVTVARLDLAGRPVFHIFVDRAAALYLWQALVPALRAADGSLAASL